MIKKLSISNILFFVITMVIFVTSLTQKIYFVEGSNDSDAMSGFLALLLGWYYMFDLRVIPWLANPLLFLSFIFTSTYKIKKAKIVGIIAFIFSLSFLLFDKILVNEGGFEKEIIGYGSGYWLWVFSMFINVVGIFISEYLNSDN
ncbi:hypothetical protein ACFSKN_18050 [Mariniflexile gromovii]|uniref:Uncharacterized protein n=2 Tax=Mariniflexile TaxID=527198 RepID=A0ABS4BWN3_9FLAO|nr:hypothetical protein [Mariniflexile gromovii]MBP0904998.1 hypothetical protein [Mariniflexile gromovii]